MGKYLITIGIIAYIAVMLWVIWVVYSRITAKKILNNSRRKKSFAFSYLSVRFGRNKTLRNITLPVANPSAKSGVSLVNIGLVFLNKGGVFVINVIPGSGFVENVRGSVWTRTFNDKQYQFNDPFVQNEVGVKAIKSLLRREHIDNVPIHNIVLFTGKKVKFARRFNGLITVDELTPFMIDLNKDRFLMGSEIRRIVRLLNKKRIRRKIPNQ